MKRIWIYWRHHGDRGFHRDWGEVVMHLWNWNLPAVFGWRQITSGRLSECSLSAGFCSEI
jgi:hypothetical protein